MSLAWFNIVWSICLGMEKAQDYLGAIFKPLRRQYDFNTIQQDVDFNMILAWFHMI